jgi:predicted nucleotidyltransferase
MWLRVLAFVMVFAALVPAAFAGDVDILDVKVEKQAYNRYGFEVTLKHEDTGWDHYADSWEVVGPDGHVYGRRVLHHPHVNEQPFTRSLGGVEIPDGVTQVRIRAHDNVHGWSHVEKTVELPR